MKNTKHLCDLAPGERGKVCRSDITGDKGGIGHRLRDIGLICGTEVECVGKSPCGDPKAYSIRGAIIAIRNTDCREVEIFPLPSPPKEGRKKWD